VVLDQIPSGDPNTQSLYNVTMDDISIWGASADAQGFSVAGTGVLLDTGSNLLSVPSSVRHDELTNTDDICNRCTPCSATGRGTCTPPTDYTLCPAMPLQTHKRFSR
jgi:hypothetical protein